MAVQVYMPQKEDKLGKILQIGGAIGGGVLGAGGGPMGIIKGAGAGASLGGLAGGMLSQDQGPSAVERRMGTSGIQAPQAPPAEDPQAVMRDAMIALRDQPKEVQQDYAPQLQAAMLKMRRGQA